MKYVQDCNDILPASTATIKKWKDTASLSVDLLCEKGPKNNIFAVRDKIWAVKHDQQPVYLLHPCWFTEDKKIKALCITNGCNTVCAINALNAHYRYHKLQTYKVCEIDFFLTDLRKKFAMMRASVSVHRRNKTCNLEE